LFGGLTWKHERFIQAAFQACGYRFQALPNPTLTSYNLGRAFGNPGQCNPAYFTVGNLIQYLRDLETRGLSKQEIVDNYVFFTAGSCGPCRFGMYESEYRMALENAGFDGFRVLLFSHNDGIKAQSGEPGLKFSVDLGMGAMNALNLGDITNVHQPVRDPVLRHFYSVRLAPVLVRHGSAARRGRSARAGSSS
jgi:predicted nucleotide-binding protein (sugar kinase/HSP70/actin superfamily)